MGLVLLALGLVLVVEGVIYAVAPAAVERLLDVLREMSLEHRRLAGLAAVAAGVALVWTARATGTLHGL